MEEYNKFAILGTEYVNEAEIELSRKFLFHSRNSSFITVIKKTLKLSVLSDKMNCILSAFKAKSLMKDKSEIDGITQEKKQEAR